MILNKVMSPNFDTFCTQVLSEMMPASFEGEGGFGGAVSKVTKSVPPGITSGHFSPLQKITDSQKRETVIKKIISAVLKEKGNTYSPTANDKQSFKDELKAAILAAKSEDFKVNNTSAGFLADRIWTAIGSDIKFTAGSTEPPTVNKEVVVQKVIKAVEEETPSSATEEPKEQTETDQDREETSAPKDEKELDKVLEGTYGFTEDLFNEFSKKIEDFNAKSARKGVPSITIERTGEKMVEVQVDKVSSFAPPMQKIIQFKIEVPPLSLPGGWKFVARVDHEDYGNVIVGVPDSEHGAELHKMFGKSQPSYCDHCQTTRRRTSTFVVQNEKGKLIRIGRQCLRSYLPGGEREISKMIDFAHILTNVALGLGEYEQRQQRGEGGGGSGSPKYFSANDVLGLTIAFAQTLGYMSRKKSQEIFDNTGESGPEPTAQKVMNALTGVTQNAVKQWPNDEKIKREFEIIQDYSDNQEKYKKEADEIIDWAGPYLKSEIDNPNNTMKEYLQNLSVIVGALSKDEQSKAINKKHISILTSLYPIYKRNTDQKEEASKKIKKISEHVGTVGFPIGDLNYADKAKFKKSGLEIDLNKFPYNGAIPVTVTSTGISQKQRFGPYRYNSNDDDRGDVSHWYKFEDENGNKYIYWHNHYSGLGLEKGNKAKIIRAIVKKHDLFEPKPTQNLNKDPKKDTTKTEEPVKIKQTAIIRANIVADQTEVKEELELPSFEEWYSNS